MGGVAATFVVTNIDRRTTGTQIEDESIEQKAQSRIRTALGESADVSVTSYNRRVLLTGYVKNNEAKAKAKQIASSVENTNLIFDEIQIGDKSTLSEKSSDLALVARVKIAFFDAKDIQSSAFKVVADRGTIYLMGRVTNREADRATSIAANVSNVKKVIKIFEEISEKELAELSPKEPQK